MLSKFTVENFGSIKDKVTLSMEADRSTHLENYYIVKPNAKDRLLKLAFIYGANASGKTNIIRSIDFLCNFVRNPPHTKNQPIILVPFLFQENPFERTSKFDIEFYSSGIKYSYQLELSHIAVHSERLYNLKSRKSLVFERTTNLKSQLTEIKFGSTIKVSKTDKEILEANTLWNNSVLSGFLKTNLESSDLTLATEFFASYLENIIMPRSDLKDFTTTLLQKNPELKNTILELLQKADFKISDVNIKTLKLEVTGELLAMMPSEVRSHFEHNRVSKEGMIERKDVIFQHQIGDKFYDLTYESESQGTKRYFEFSGILALLVSGRKGILIDEIESSLHPDLMKHFLMLFLVNSKNSQIICTSHYRELLMEKELFRPDAVWFAEKMENGATDLFSLVDFDTSIVRNTSSFYNAYKIGKLGAVPHLSDPYFNGNGEKN